MEWLEIDEQSLAPHHRRQIQCRPWRRTGPAISARALGGWILGLRWGSKVLL
jgi:hypothetical protein